MAERNTASARSFPLFYCFVTALRNMDLSPIGRIGPAGEYLFNRFSLTSRLSIYCDRPAETIESNVVAVENE